MISYIGFVDLQHNIHTKTLHNVSNEIRGALHITLHAAAPKAVCTIANHPAVQNNRAIRKQRIKQDGSTNAIMQYGYTQVPAHLRDYARQEQRAILLTPGCKSLRRIPTAAHLLQLRQRRSNHTAAVLPQCSLQATLAHDQQL
jgi:hypothetical protein